MRLRLTTYFGERDRDSAPIDTFASARDRSQRVAAGRGGLRSKASPTDTLLSLSEDLPMVAIAVDTAKQINAVLGKVQRTGLVAVERTSSRDVTGPAQLTLYRTGGRRSYVAVCDALHRHGAEGATVLLGVDGTVGGERRRW